MDDIKLVLVSESGKHMYVRTLIKEYHCQYGVVKKEDLKPGNVKTNTGAVLYGFEPEFTDLYKKIKRGPQIIPLKDVGPIVAETGINNKSLVVDAGTGSGALSCFLANLVRQVVSYEIREDFANIAKKNIKSLKLKNIFVKKKDVYKGIDEKNVDLITLDLPEPWKAIENCKTSIKVGGFIVSYSPTVPQVSDFIEAVGQSGLLYLKTIEIINREWEFHERVVRPRSQQIGHSGFLTFVRKFK